jgi:hypothetical protein
MAMSFGNIDEPWDSGMPYVHVFSDKPHAIFG